MLINIFLSCCSLHSSKSALPTLRQTSSTSSRRERDRNTLESAHARFLFIAHSHHAEDTSCRCASSSSTPHRISKTSRPPNYKQPIHLAARRQSQSQTVPTAMSSAMRSADLQEYFKTHNKSKEQKAHTSKVSPVARHRHKCP